ncbi:MAG TPA: SGNH/GDSL hydrolase family protein [Bacteroidia bacterium]|nr:SGNH/GDSL hydrolase family protein [Bacteroidia bacterium]
MKNIFQLISLVVLVQIVSCKPNLEIPEPSQGSADFSRTVAIGGDFLSGYQDGALYPEGQQYSIPNLLADKFKLASSSLTFNQPLISDADGAGINNKPWESEFITRSLLFYKTDCKGVRDLSPVKWPLSKDIAEERIKSFTNGSIQNLAMPFCKTADVFDPAFGSAAGNFYYSHFTSEPDISTLLNDALRQHPTFGIFWLGMEDIFSYAAHGGKDVTIPASAAFETSLDSILKSFAANGAKGVIANIPDLESFPFYTLISSRGITLTLNQADSLNQLTGLQLYFEGENGFFVEYPKNSGYYRQMEKGEYVLLDVPIDSLKCQSLGLLQPLPDRYTLDSMEVQVIKEAIANYNSIIFNKANQYSLAYVDANAFFKKVESGMKWDGVDLNAEFVSGGFFSLDGYHPHQKGYSILSNEFVRAINDHYGATVPWINCESCSGILFP